MTVFKILALILGLVLGFKLVHWGAQMLAPYIGDANGFLPIISFLAIFIGVIALVNILGKLVQQTLKMILLGTIDKFAGALLNLLRWAFMIGTILWLMKRGGIGLQDAQTQGSFLYPLLINTAPLIIDFFSQMLPFASDVVDYIKELKL